MEPAFDLQQDEFGDRLTKIEKLVEDTNRQVHSMRRAARTRSLISVVWWIFIIAVSAYTYYVFVQPYVEQIMGAYTQTQDFGSQMQNAWSQFFGSSTPR